MKTKYYSNEMTETSVGYTYPTLENRFPEEWVTDVYRQVGILEKLFPEIGEKFRDITIPDRLPLGAEGFFVIPRWEALGGNYQEATLRALEGLEETPLLEEECRYTLFERYVNSGSLFGQTRKNKSHWDLLHQQQQKDVLVIPAQFGRLHAGRSARLAEVCCGQGEFPLGVFEIAIMLSTTPRRLSSPEELGTVLCPGSLCNGGDEYVYEFSYLPGNDNLVLSASPNGEHDEGSSTPTGFLP